MDSGTGDILWDPAPASEWAEGYPIGSGRLGAMVLGRPLNERVALNHELLWRDYIKYAKRRTSGDIAAVKALCAEKRYDEADALLRRTVPDTGKALYINPFVPAGDLYINMRGCEYANNYRRVLNMAEGTVKISFESDGAVYERESFCSEAGVIVTHITCDRAGRLSGEIALSRLEDPDCEVTGCAEYKKLSLSGAFEEGRRFAVVTKVESRGGRIAVGRSAFAPHAGQKPKKVLGLEYVFSNEEMYGPEAGVSLCFAACDELTIYTAICVDTEIKDKYFTPEEYCSEILYRAEGDFCRLKDAHIEKHQSLYGKCRVNFEDTKENRALSAPELIEKCRNDGRVCPALAEKLFNISRYLAIASGAPSELNGEHGAPINLQGVWNQDRFPAWECDYHLDLNLEMCYWPLDALNLGELVPTLMAWVKRVSVWGRDSARDLYGCGGLVFNGCCDNETIGTPDSVGFGFTGAAAWLALILWRHFEYTHDREYLKNDLYPFMREIAAFYKDYLIEKDGFLLCPFGSSPEVQVVRGDKKSFLASAATIDIELSRELFKNLIDACEILGENADGYREIYKKLPLPKIRGDGAISEFWEDYVPADPGHRHRSLLVWLCPGTRISPALTPNWADAAYKTIQNRLKNEDAMSIGLTYALDAQLLARLGKGNEAYERIGKYAQIHLMRNGLSTINDYSGRLGGEIWFKGHKLFQIEACIGIGGAITDMLLSDREGYLTPLPGLPDALHNGSAEGLAAAKGFEVSLSWEEMKLKSFRIKSRLGGKCAFMPQKGMKITGILCEGSRISYQESGEIVSFETEKGKEYEIIK